MLAQETPYCLTYTIFGNNQNLKLVKMAERFKASQLAAPLQISKRGGICAPLSTLAKRSSRRRLRHYSGAVHRSCTYPISESQGTCDLRPWRAAGRGLELRW